MKPPVERPLVRRLVMGTALLSLIALAALYGAVHWVTSAAITRSLTTAVDTDIAGLADIYASGGEAELIARLRDRQALTVSEGRRAHYLLADATGRTLVGPVRPWPALAASRSESGYITLSGAGPVFARATLLSPTLRLLVARDYTSDQAQLRQLGWTFASVALGIWIAALALAHFAGKALLRRLSRITLALQHSDGGALALAGEAGPARDEIALLAQTSADLIGRANRLAELHRHMSDHVAHEVRTPLMHLDNRLVAALRGGSDAAAVQGQIESARRDIRSIAALLDSLLDIAASEARRGDPTGLTSVNLSALARELVELYQPSFEESDLNLAAAITPDVVMEGEAMQLTRLLSNLLDNASKYVPAGGTVILTVAPGPLLMVEDNGPGIDPAVRPHLFERFRRGAVHGTRGGHGLGLALARAIAERHGLTLHAEDAHPGTRFRVEPEPVA